MKIEKSVIVEKLKKIKTAIPSKADGSFVQGVLMREGVMYASNPEMGMTAKFDEMDGYQFVLPQKAIEMVMQLPDGEMEIIADQQTVQIKMGGIDNKFQTTSPYEFVIGSMDFSQGEVSIDGETLQKAISSVLYAVGENTSKPILNGVLLQGDGVNLNVVGCDGFRIAWAKVPYEQELNVVIPKATATKMLSLGFAGNVSIRTNDRKAEFRMDEYAITTNLYEGKYIEYARNFPKYSKSVLVNRKQLLDSIQRGGICSEDKSRPVVILEFEKDGILLSTRSSTGTYTEKYGEDTGTEDGIKISFNGKYLADCLKSYDWEMVELSFDKPLVPMVVGDETLLSLVLPLRI